MYPILYISPESSRAWVLGLRSWGLHVYDVVSILISLVFLFLLCVHHCINYNINYAKCHIYSAQAWSLEAMSHVYSWTALETLSFLSKVISHCIFKYSNYYNNIIFKAFLVIINNFIFNYNSILYIDLITKYFMNSVLYALKTNIFGGREVLE